MPTTRARVRDISLEMIRVRLNRLAVIKKQEADLVRRHPAHERIGLVEALAQTVPDRPPVDRRLQRPTARNRRRRQIGRMQDVAKVRIALRRIEAEVAVHHPFEFRAAPVTDQHLIKDGLAALRVHLHARRLERCDVLLGRACNTLLAIVKNNFKRAARHACSIRSASRRASRFPSTPKLSVMLSAEAMVGRSTGLLLHSARSELVEGLSVKLRHAFRRGHALAALFQLLECAVIRDHALFLARRRF